MEPTLRVRLRDVAAQANVSVATVSKVVNRRYGVSPATIARVQAVIEELGYQGSPLAWSPRGHRSNVIGILVADLEPFSTELLKGAADALRDSGYELVVHSPGGPASGHEGWERRHLSRLSGTLLDGAVVVTPSVVDVRYPAPIVAVDPHTGSGDLPSVDADSLLGARLATEHLIALGHQRIALLAGRPDLQSAQLREEGYRQAMGAAGIPVHPDLVRAGGYDPGVSATAVRALLALDAPPTAIFAANDVSALAAVAVAAERGLRVPGDLSLVGFDNIPDAALCDPPLTTVEQPIQQLGRRATELLVQLIRGEPVENRHVTLATRLVVRQSTSAPPPLRPTKWTRP